MWPGLSLSPPGRSFPGLTEFPQVLAGPALRSAKRSRGLKSSLSGAFSPRGCSELGTEDSPVSQLSAWSFNCLPASAFLPIPHTTAWTLSPGREVGQLQGSLRFVFCLSWGSLPFVALCPHCLENCCSTFFRGLFFRCIRWEGKSVPLLHLSGSRSVHYVFIPLCCFQNPRLKQSSFVTTNSVTRLCYPHPEIALTLKASPWDGCQITPISRIRELSLREVKRLVQSHPVYQRSSHIPLQCCPWSSQDMKQSYVK